ncbi:hypothetical protein I4U23_020047 [Adineta vaga]|nr:hypothetical protein I4U23_020047 [Adineta vaga]
MMEFNQKTIGHILAIISTISGSFTCIISLIVCFLLIHHQYYHLSRKEEKIILLLSTNIYALILIYVIVLLTCNIQTLLGDVYGTNFNTSWCIFRSYLSSVLCCAVYAIFVTQALYRLFRIVYTYYRWLQFSRVYSISAPIHLVLSFGIASPLLIWNDIVYSPDDYQCLVPFSRTRGFLWTAFISYGAPLVYLSLISIHIATFIRQQRNAVSLARNRSHQRDFRAIQRIFIQIGILIAAGLPVIIFMLMFYITGIEHPLSYRAAYLGVEVALAVLSLVMILMTPQLRNIIIKKWKSNQVIVIQRPTPTRPSIPANK